jgi:hypothetical protein
LEKSATAKDVGNDKAESPCYRRHNQLVCLPISFSTILQN